LSLCYREANICYREACICFQTSFLSSWNSPDQYYIITSRKTFDDAVYDNIAKMMINIANLDATRKRLHHLPGDLGGLGIDY